MTQDEMTELWEKLESALALFIEICSHSDLAEAEAALDTALALRKATEERVGELEGACQAVVDASLSARQVDGVAVFAPAQISRAVALVTATLAAAKREHKP